MAVRLLVCSLPFLTTVTTNCLPVTAMDKTPFHVKEFTPGYCAYIRRLVGFYQTRATLLENDYECRSLDPIHRRWYLPKLDSIEKQDKLAAMIKENISVDSWQIWVGLKRNDVSDFTKSTNVTQWFELSKWFWTKDSSSLSKSYPGGVAPWATTTNTRNVAYEFLLSARCVAALPWGSRMSIQWFVTPCDLLWPTAIADVVDHSPIRKQLIVCESETEQDTPVQSTSVHEELSFQSTSVHEEPQSTSVREEPPLHAGLFQWQWILLGVALSTVLVSLAIIGTVCVVRHFLKARKLRAERFTGTTSTMETSYRSHVSAISKRSFSSSQMGRTEPVETKKTELKTGVSSRDVAGHKKPTMKKEVTTTVKK